jgi:peptidylprolyl isomerase
LLLLALALVVAACGGDDDDDSTDSTVEDSGTTTTVAGDDTSTTAAGDETTTTGPAAIGETTTTVSDREVLTEGTAEAGDLVSVHYVGTLADGEQFDSSEGRDPLLFEIGTGAVIAGFDAGVLGMEIGETKTIDIPVEDAYGERDEANILEFPIEEVPEEYRVEGIEVTMGNGQPAKVIEVGDEIVRVDVNHPLAGEALTFELELVEIQR